MNITIDCKSVSVRSYTSYLSNVELEGINENDLDTDDVAKCVSVDVFIKNKDIGDILNAIGESICRDYWEITESE